MRSTEFRKASGLFKGLMLSCLIFSLPALAVNGLILDESTDADGYGWTLMKVWGNHYEAGYAHGWLLADEIIAGYDDVSATVIRWGYSWPELRFAINTYYSSMPDYFETELTGIADGVNNRTGESIDWMDLLCINMIGDVAYLCRSLSAWGSTTDSEHSTVTIRRLDYSDMGMDMVYHHVVCMWCIDDQPEWINFGWPGYVTVVTGLNEYGVVTSLHDWNSASGSVIANSMGRTIASRYALTLFDSPDLSWQVDSAFALLSEYPSGTGSFINFMAPEGLGGVIKCSRTRGYFELRKAHPDCFGGEILYTNNSDIDGSTINDPWYSYTMLHADGDISMEGLWTSAGASFHRVCVGYNGPGNMDIWFDGVTPGGGATTRLEITWTELEAAGITENTPEKNALSMYPNPFNSALEISLPKGYSVSIYDCDGKLLVQHEGSFVWIPQNIPSGVYLIKADNGRNILSERAIYLK